MLVLHFLLVELKFFEGLVGAFEVLGVVEAAARFTQKDHGGDL